MIANTARNEEISGRVMVRHIVRYANEDHCGERIEVEEIRRMFMVGLRFHALRQRIIHGK